MDKTPAYRRIADLLAAAITAGDLPKGALIKVSEAAAVFESSRSPVKQAFEILKENGLLFPHDGQGFVVGALEPTSRVQLTPELLRFDEDEAPLSSHALDELYFRLEHSLIASSISGPLRINELAMARHFNIGRSTVRELIFRALRVGIVERPPGKSWQVVAFDLERCQNLYDLRILLEPEALRLAAPFLPRDRIASMLDDVTAGAANPSGLTVLALDGLEADLHSDLLSYCPNPEIPEVLVRTSPTYICGKYIQVALSDSPTIEEFLHEHLEILAHLHRGQADEAAQLLRHHLIRSKEQIVGKLRDYLALPDLHPDDGSRHFLS